MKTGFGLVLMLGLILLGSGLIFIGLQPAQTEPLLTMKVLDIGQGDSIYLRLPSKEDILIDGGPDDRVLTQLGQAMPFGDHQIELVIISHNHADHIGGLLAVLQRYQVKEIWLSGAIHTTDQYLQLLQLIKEKQIKTSVVKAGSLATYGGVHFLVLFPLTEMTGQQPEDQHDATVVVKVSWQQWCALLTGDLDIRHEQMIIPAAASLNESLHCPILKVTHHGSAHGTSPAFLTAVQPEVGLISVGAKNMYHHPAPSLLERLRQAQVQTYRTDTNGTVTLTTNGLRYWTKTER